ncbi:MAG: zinc ribbon domain-containing protein [Acidaminococcaceae bacterium]|nr:zinc ribbon domain-containing protein [Acidaminococcaceae bacterium]
MAYNSNYIYNEHPAIIDAHIWDGVCERLAREEKQRNIGVHKKSNSHFLYGKIFCAECGQAYSRHTARGKDGLYKTWRCNGRIRRTGCHNRHIGEEVLLEEIKTRLGWENGLEVSSEKMDFDEWGFDQSVNKVIVMAEKVEVIMMDDEKCLN